MNKNIEIKAGKIIINAPYDACLIGEIKCLLEGRRWLAKSKSWSCPITLKNLFEVKKMARIYELTISQDVAQIKDEEIEKALAQSKKKKEEILAKSTSVASNIKIDGLNGELREFQKAGVSYVVNQKAVIIADEQGLGKTIQAIASVVKMEALPAVIIVPAIVKLNWKKEIEKWVTGAEVHVAGVSKKSQSVEIDKAKWIVVNYEIISKYLNELVCKKPKAIIFDESQYLKNGKSKRTQTVKELVNKTDLNLRLMLTGTPIMNRPNELIEPLRILGLLDTEFKGWKNYVTRYCDGKRESYGWNTKGASNLDELNSLLRATCMIRRDKKQVLSELPEKMHTTVQMEMASSTGYNKELKKFTFWLDNELNKLGIKLRPNKGGKTVSIKQKILAMMSQDSPNILAQMNILRRCTGIGKVPAILKWISNYQDTTNCQPLVIFAYHKDVQHAIKDALPDAGVITGSMTAEARQAAVEDFQIGKRKTIICSLKAAQTGITLTAASNVLMTELDWTPSALAQAEDRCHRIGQKNAVNVYQCVSIDNTGFDAVMLDLIESKQNIITNVINNCAINDDRIDDELKEVANG